MTQQISAWSDALKIMRISPVHLRGYECTIYSLFRRGDCEQATSLRGGQ